MLTERFAELDRLCPQGTRSDHYESSRTLFYGTWRASRPDKAFKYLDEPVCPEALRVLWCCWHLGVRVLLNYGLSRYSAEHQLRANAAETSQYLGEPWISANAKGGLFSDRQDDDLDTEPDDMGHTFMSDGLWIGTGIKREIVLLKNVLAIRQVMGNCYPPLYVANEYKPPEFVLSDERPGYFALRHEGAFVSRGKTFVFAERLVERFGGTLVNETQIYRSRQPKLVQSPDRLLRIRKKS